MLHFLAINACQKVETNLFDLSFLKTPLEN